jgi:RDD family.
VQKEFGGLWPRLKALILDYIVIAVYLVLIVLLGLLLKSLAPSFVGAVFGKEYSSELFGFITITLPVSLYFALSEASSQQATWGKRIGKLKVLCIKDGKRLSTARSFVRTALKFIPWELSHASIWYITFHPDSFSPLFTIGITIVFLLVGLNILVLVLNHKHQTLYDMIAGTFVEKTFSR